MTSQAVQPTQRKSIFITGAASGMGRETAKLFAAKGWFVGASDVNEAGLKTLEQELGHDNCFVRKLDVTDKADFDTALAEFAKRTNGKLDLMYNNAGIGESGWFEDVPYEATMRVVSINFVGVLNGVYAALPYLKATPGSLLFTTSSSSATYGMPRIAVYAATKHAVKGLTEALSVEFQRHGVRVADVLPGLIDTAILRSTPNRSGDAPKPSEDEFYARAPKKGMFRLMPADSVAKCVWEAYHGNKLHYYVPSDVAWIDRIKGFAPNFIRNRIMKMLPGLDPTAAGK
ncbi:MAG: SDR family oxidoreductase [Alphaproteobacteria bacterium]|nr:SDR family oxidoreductase [Alphaproteobacteria bacterium]